MGAELRTGQERAQAELARHLHSVREQAGLRGAEGLAVNRTGMLAAGAEAVPGPAQGMGDGALGAWVRQRGIQISDPRTACFPSLWHGWG